MALKQDNLKYIKVVKGRIAHFIFQQGTYYFILTETDNQSRGNFLTIRQEEVEKVKAQLSQPNIPLRFHCDNIYKNINGLAIRLDHQNPQFFINRLRNICYILVANGQLEIWRDGNSIWFSKRLLVPTLPTTPEATSPPSPPSPGNQRSYVPCPLCHPNAPPVRKDRLQKHRCKAHPDSILSSSLTQDSPTAQSATTRVNSPSTSRSGSDGRLSQPVMRQEPMGLEDQRTSHACGDRFDGSMDVSEFIRRTPPHDSDGTFLSAPGEDRYDENSGPDDVYKDDQ